MRYIVVEDIARAKESLVNGIPKCTLTLNSHARVSNDVKDHGGLSFLFPPRIMPHNIFANLSLNCAHAICESENRASNPDSSFYS